MMEWQHTIAKPISFSGKGLHTGKISEVRLVPADEDFGIRFKRVDLEGDVLIAADCDKVVDVSRGTTIAHENHRVATIEHLMSAVSAMGIDNLLIEVNGPEIPILDGSARPFVQKIKETGLSQQTAVREIFVLEETIHFYDAEKDVEMTAIPYSQYALTTMIDFDSMVIGRQYIQLKNISNYEEEISAARTFCFLHEVEELYRQGLIQGGELDCAIVVAEQEIGEEEVKHLAEIFQEDLGNLSTHGVINLEQLRYDDEMARHKLLDVIGDLSLVGTPFQAKIIASKPGHATNVAFAKMIKKHIRQQKKLQEIPAYNPNDQPLIDLVGIQQILPHRAPFLLVDKIMEMDENIILGIKNVTFNEAHFAGHFPDKPVMPGVLQIEAMAQTGGILAIQGEEDKEDLLTLLVSVDQCKFRRTVEPGDTLLIKMELLEKMKRRFRRMKGMIYVGNQLVSEAILTAKIYKP